MSDGELEAKFLECTAWGGLPRVTRPGRSCFDDRRCGRRPGADQIHTLPLIRLPSGRNKQRLHLEALCRRVHLAIVGRRLEALRRREHAGEQVDVTRGNDERVRPAQRPSGRRVRFVRSDSGSYHVDVGVAPSTGRSAINLIVCSAVFRSRQVALEPVEVLGVMVCASSELSEHESVDRCRLRRCIATACVPSPVDADAAYQTLFSRLHRGFDSAPGLGRGPHSDWIGRIF